MSTRLKNLNKLLPFVAIGTVADCQSVIDPINRLLVKTGMQYLETSKGFYPGLKELIKQTGLAEKIDQGYLLSSQDMGYTLSPILNSSGRVTHAQLSIQSLIEEENPKQVASELIETNQQRKLMVASILEDVEKEALDQVLEGANNIWLQGDWSKGIVGLLASRLVNHYRLPVAVLSIDPEQPTKATASLRAPEGYHIPKALKATGEELFEKFGGHPGAAGFSAKTSNLLKIRECLKTQWGLQQTDLRLNKINYIPSDFIFPANMTVADFGPKLDNFCTDKSLIWLSVSDLTINLFKSVMDMDPYGQDLPFPRFIFWVKEFGIRLIGQNKNHAKIFLKNGLTVTLFNIDTGLQESFSHLSEAITEQNFVLWIIAKVSQNSWQGQTKLELVGEDYVVTV